MKLCPDCKAGNLSTFSVCAECGEDISGQPTATPQDLGGLVLDRKYRFENFLGQGAMGFVYRAKHMALDRDVAVKLMQADREPGEEQIRRFEREALSASRLIHPHIVAVLDFGRTRGGLIYMVIEYIPGDTLYALENRIGPMPVARAYGIMHQVMSAVEEAHNHSVVHRDLKPENVIVTPMRTGEDFAKVLDFGIAVLMDDKSSESRGKNDFAGTPGYLAPEHIMGEEATALCDIYALGSMFFEALAGKPAFHGSAPMEIINLQLTTSPPSLATALDGARHGVLLDPVLKKAMARDPAERYQSVAELRDAVADAFSTLSEAHVSCSTCQRPRDPETNLCSLHRASRPIESEAVLDSGLIRSRTAAQTIAMGRDSFVFDRDEMLGLLRRAPVVDRDAETEEVVGFLEGEGRDLEVIGPPNSGKSALVGNAADALGGMGIRVLSCGPDPTSSATPWYSLREVLTSSLGFENKEDQVAGALSAFQQLDLGETTLRAVRAIFCDSGMDSSPEPALDESAIYGGFVDAMQKACSGTMGTCLVIDDAEEIDRGSRRLLVNWLISDDWRPTWVIAASSKSFLPSTHPAKILRLTPLPLGDDDLYSARVRRLSDEEREVLQVIAQLGMNVSIDLLEEFLDPTQLFLSLDQLSRVGLVSPGPAGSVSLAHRMVMVTALDSFESLEVRKRLNLRILGHLERGSHSVYRLARHARESGDTERAVDLLEKAGDQARHCGDHDGAALDFYKVAVHCARWEMLLPDEDPRYLELSVKLGEALLRSGHKLSAEVVFKELLGYARRDEGIAQRARAGLASLGQPR